MLHTYYVIITYNNIRLYLTWENVMFYYVKKQNSKHKRHDFYDHRKEFERLCSGIMDDFYFFFIFLNII